MDIHAEVKEEFWLRWNRKVELFNKLMDEIDSSNQKELAEGITELNEAWHELTEVWSMTDSLGIRL